METTYLVNSQLKTPKSHLNWQLRPGNICFLVTAVALTHGGACQKEPSLQLLFAMARFGVV